MELGIAYADKYINKKNRVLIGLHTDARVAICQAKLNPMLRDAVRWCFLPSLLVFLKDGQEYKTKNTVSREGNVPRR